MVTLWHQVVSIAVVVVLTFVFAIPVALDRSFLGHKINIGYQNGLFLNGLLFPAGEGKVSLANAPHWNAATIESRTKVMVEMIAKANRLPGE